MRDPLSALVPLKQRSAYSLAAYYIFDRVTVSHNGIPLLSFLGTVKSDYRSGPSLFWVADATAQATGLRGTFGLLSARRLN